MQCRVVQTNQSGINCKHLYRVLNTGDNILNSIYHIRVNPLNLKGD